MSSPDNCFPADYSAQYVRLPNALTLAHRPPSEIVTYFREHREAAEDLLQESYDKRCVPSTFIEEIPGGFRVGWCSAQRGCECVRTFMTLADAATDYLLFSLGKGRWSAAEPT